MENIILYITSFIIGTLLGSFFTLAVYRIPLKQDITHKRSYCPNCNHILNFWDLIPILSYIFLGGKCRYCRTKIRPRYLILELISGITFLLFTISTNISIFNLNSQKIIYLVFGIIYISTLIIIGGIEKENHNINKSVMTFGLITEAIYITYLYSLHVNIYRYIIYFIIAIILLWKSKNKYAMQILALCFYLCLGTSEEIAIFAIIITLLLIALKTILQKIMHKEESSKEKNIPIGFYLTFSNIFILILQNLLLIK